MGIMSKLLTFVNIIFCCLSFDVKSEVITVYTNIESGISNNHPILLAAQQWLSDASLEMDLKHAPMSRAIKQTLNQPNTLILPIYRLESREKLFVWFCPLANGRDIYLYRKRSMAHFNVTNVEQAKSYVIGGMRVTIVEEVLFNVGFKKRHLDLTTYGKTNFNKLLKDRVHFIAQSPQYVEKLLKQYHFPHNYLVAQLKISDKNQFLFCAAMSKQSNPSLIANLRHSFNQYINNPVD